MLILENLKNININNNNMGGHLILLFSSRADTLDVSQYECPVRPVYCRISIVLPV